MFTKAWLEIGPCAECGAGSGKLCAPYCVAPESSKNSRVKMYALTPAGVRVSKVAEFALNFALSLAVTLPIVWLFLAAWAD
jgi:hypothetical protein